MEYPALRTRLAAEAARFQDAAAAADPDAAVPTCPAWTTTDLLDHVIDVYDHKIASIRSGAAPGGDYRTPRPGTLLDQYAGALADLLAVFDDTTPDSPAYAWPGAEPTVGFWIRRLTHETLIHRVDAELAAARAPGPIDAALAEDGIDEMLTVILDRGLSAHREHVSPALESHAGLVVALDTGDRSWTVRVGDGTVDVADGARPDAQALVRAEAGAVLQWLWQRLPAQALPAEGDAGRAAALHAVMGAFGG